MHILAHPIWSATASACALVACAADCRAQSETESKAQGAGGLVDSVVSDDSREWIGGAPWTDWTRALGDWRGARTWLEEHGVEVGASITSDWAGNWRGGIRNRETLMSLPDVNIAFDLERLLGLPRTLAFVDCYAPAGQGIAGDIGTVQGVSNIESIRTAQVAEAWLETWFGDAVRFKFGKVDFNSEFAFSEIGSEFLNPSAGISPTVQSGPTFPATATSANLFLMPTECSYLGVGIYDGAGAVGVNTGSQGFSGFFRDDESDDYFTIVEAGTGWTGGNSWGSGRLAIGGWFHGEQFERFDGATERGASGGYAIVDQVVWRENPDDGDDVQGLGITANVAISGSDDVVTVPLHTQAGVVWTGLFEGRDDDAIGLLVSHAQLSEASGSPYVGAETILELVYRLQVTPSVILRPDLQYVINPGGDPTLDDALVGMLRVEITF
jgi:porin